MGGQRPASHYLRIYARRLSEPRIAKALSDSVSELVDRLRTLQPDVTVSAVLFHGTTVFALPDKRQAAGCFLHHGEGIPVAGDFEDHVDRIIEFLARTASDTGRAFPKWTRIVVAASEGAHYLDGPWEPVEVFSGRFTEILTRTTRDWVNLTVSDIRDETLFLVVEFVASPTGGTKIPIELISVNLSGPSQWAYTLPPA